MSSLFAALLIETTALRVGNANSPCSRAPSKCPLPVLLLAGCCAWHNPTVSSAASVTYDFGYRMERALDPNKRGPSDEIQEQETGAGLEMLDAMCNPPVPEPTPTIIQ